MADEVVGVEISPVSAAHARHRAATNGWSNVEVVRASAQEVRLTGLYDGLLMFAAPDVYSSKPSLAQLAPHLREGARVVLFGSKTSMRRHGWLLNSPLNFAMTRLSLPTTPGLEAEPWRLAAEQLGEFVVEEYFYGWMFIAAGSFRASPRNDAQPL
jgi:hypothetical protein